MEELVMKRKLALFTILPSIMWLLAMHGGYSQSDLNNEAGTVAPLYYSYTYNMPISNDHWQMLEGWMLYETTFEDAREPCYYLKSWMLDDAFMLSFGSGDLLDWMMGDMLASDYSEYDMQQWMLGFEPLVESALYKAELASDVESWMLEFNVGAQQFIEEAFLSIKEWMLSNSFTETESAIDIEDWMMYGLSMY